MSTDIDTAIDKCDAYSKKHPELRYSVWSLFDELNFEKIAFPGVVRITYEAYGDTIVKIESNRLVAPTWGTLWAEAEKLIVTSGDLHHIYIESFTPTSVELDGTQRLEMNCGS
jgi:hypothetical protein